MKVSQSGTFEELFKFLQVQSQKPSSAMMELALMRTATGIGRPGVTSAAEDEFPASEIAAQINASQISRNRHISGDYPPFALMPAFHALGILSTRFMR